ncbi:MAG: hypothetical protein KGP10_09035 [Actinomycetales bacterium]|nr:hypothetical protein [Actinomycetales bacterium]
MLRRAAVALAALIIGAGVVVGGIAVVVGVGVFAVASGSEPAPLTATVTGTKQTAEGTLPHAELDLAVYPNSSASVPPPRTFSPIQADWLTGQPFYSPSTSIVVPANSVVTIHFSQYDSGGSLYNSFFAKVHGSLDGTMMVNGKPVDSLPLDKVAHTFTVHQYPEGGQPDFFLSVPLPMNPANAPTGADGYPTTPQKVSVTFRTGEPGSYVWNCEFPCGDMYQQFGGPMQTRGWMAGTFEVV